jgi:ABC-type transport system involved in multi-copper enzyme maturation permease subunit
MRLFAEERSTGTLEMLMTAPVRDWQVVLSKFIACYLFYVLLWVPTLVYLPVLLDLHVAGVSERIAAATNPGAAVTCGVGVLAAAAVAALGLLTMAFRPFAGFILMLVGLLATLGGVLAFTHFVPPGPGQQLSVSAGIDPMPVVASYLGLALAGAMFLTLGLWVSSLVRSQIVAALLSLALGLVFVLGGLLVLGGFVPMPGDTGVWSYRALSFLSVPLHFSQYFSRGQIDTRNVVLYVSVALAGLFLTVRSLESRRWQ